MVDLAPGAHLLRRQVAAPVPGIRTSNRLGRLALAPGALPHAGQGPGSGSRARAWEPNHSAPNVRGPAYARGPLPVLGRSLDA